MPPQTGPCTYRCVACAAPCADDLKPRIPSVLLFEENCASEKAVLGTHIACFKFQDGMYKAFLIISRVATCPLLEYMIFVVFIASVSFIKLILNM